MATPPQAEKELQRLRNLPENKICPNCGKQDRMLGFQAVCVAYKTFLCSECKSAHQAFSHRCKSVSMSNWTMLEVQALDERHGGGNRVAAATWLATVPEGARPSSDSHMDMKKAFVDRAYNRKEWVGSAPKESANSAPARQAAATSAAPSVPAMASRGVQQRTAAASVPTVNLLDDDASFGASSSGAAAPANATTSTAGACNLLDDEFFAPTNPTQNITAAAPSDADRQGGAPSAFSFISSPAAPAQTSFSSQAFPATATLQDVFDPFATPGQTSVSSTAVAGFCPQQTSHAASSMPMTSGQIGGVFGRTLAPTLGSFPPQQTGHPSSLPGAFAHLSGNAHAQVPPSAPGSLAPQAWQQGAPMLGQGGACCGGLMPQSYAPTPGPFTQQPWQAAAMPGMAGPCYGGQNSTMPFGQMGTANGYAAPPAAAGFTNITNTPGFTSTQAAAAATLGAGCGLSTPAHQAQQSIAGSSAPPCQASSFDPFDPFAPN